MISTSKYAVQILEKHFLHFVYAIKPEIGTEICQILLAELDGSINTCPISGKNTASTVLNL